MNTKQIEKIKFPRCPICKCPHIHRTGIGHDADKNVITWGFRCGNCEFEVGGRYPDLWFWDYSKMRDKLPVWKSWKFWKRFLRWRKKVLKRARRIENAAKE